MREIELKCPNCGATAGADFVAVNVWRCRFCRTDFVVEDHATQTRAALQRAIEASRGGSGSRNAGSSRLPWRALRIPLVLLGCLVVAIVAGKIPNPREPSSSTESRHAAHDRGKSSPPAPRLTATFHYDRTVKSGDYSYVLGEVTNTSKVPIGSAKVYVVFKDAAGKEIGSKSGFTESDHIAPGQRVPFSAILSHPPHYAKLAFDVSASAPIMKSAEGLRLEKNPPRVGSYGQYVFSGKVVNDGKAIAKFVTVEVVARDAQGRMLGVNNNFADNNKLAPGASTRYEVSSVGYPPDAHPAKFDYLVWGERK